MEKMQWWGSLFEISDNLHILLPKYLQQWGRGASYDNISFDPSPTFYIYTIAYKQGYIYKRIC